MKAVRPYAKITVTPKGERALTGGGRPREGFGGHGGAVDTAQPRFGEHDGIEDAVGDGAQARVDIAADAVHAHVGARTQKLRNASR